MNVLILSYGKTTEIENSLKIIEELKDEHNLLMPIVIQYEHKDTISLMNYKNFSENKKYKHLFYYFYQDRFINEMSELDGYVSIDNSIEDMWKNFYRVVNFIEEVFIDFKPDIVYSGSPDNYFVNLFIKIAEIEKVKYFWLEQSYFQKDAFTFFSDIVYSNDIFKNRKIDTLEELENYFKKDVMVSNPTMFIQSNIKEKIKNNLFYFSRLSELNKYDKLDLMLLPYVSMPLHNIKNKIIRLKNSLVNKIVLKKALNVENIKVLAENKKLILLALHYQPEAITLSAQPLFNNQYQLIKLISDVLPPNYLLVVKEHPLQNIGLRHPYIYKQILAKKNIKIIKQNISSSFLLENNYIDRVMSIGGTIGFEEILKRKSCLVFSDIFYSNFSYTFKANLKTIDTFILSMKEFLEFDYNKNKEEYEEELKLFLNKYYLSIIKNMTREESIRTIISNKDRYWD